ncbi:MAG: DUF3791 domain-containing protein [Oscillospiraceae bacterium]|nr:DUF3791 domain-containing protein [Oscillospiraceae bacterium]
MSQETKFTVFCMESYKVHKALTGRQVSELFEKHGVFDYIREFYDVLHTTGYQYINHDIDIYLNARNAAMPT